MNVIFHHGSYIENNHYKNIYKVYVKEKHLIVGLKLIHKLEIKCTKNAYTFLQKISKE